ncbi:MAG: hypothetical protein PHN56_04245 [Candidatus Nanoarchaeia archaeon]|nr:hypothetical protein [Candidatus Nanoarchaeia archaeon]
MELAQIDNEIRELVAVLNCIPYVSTIESCSGHLEDKLNVYYKEKNIEVKSDKGMKFIKYGAMLFNTDSKYESCTKFLNEVEDLKKKYDFA